MKFKKDNMLNRWESENGMWRIEHQNGEYTIIVKTNSGAWKEICSFSTSTHKENTLIDCIKYIESICNIK